MSFVGAVGSLMAGSGLEDILKCTFAGVSKLLSGRKFPENVRLLSGITIIIILLLLIIIITILF